MSLSTKSPDLNKYPVGLGGVFIKKNLVTCCMSILFIYLQYVCMYIYIYIYANIHISLSLYIYIYRESTMCVYNIYIYIIYII